MKNIVLVDLDGTICNVKHRVQYIQKGPQKDNTKFHSLHVFDEPIRPIITLVEIFHSAGYEIVFCSCRFDTELEKTREWIRTHFTNKDLANARLLLRSKLDRREDHEIKPDLLKQAGISFDDIFIVLEDRNQVVKFWRDNGLTCLQVADGNF